MNENLRQIMNETDVWCDQEWGGPEDLRNIAWEKKFAELIVLECIELRKEMPLKGLPSEEYEEGFWEGLRQYESMIAKHFGIEK